MIPKNISEIGIEDFENLIKNGVAESKTIEYKQELQIAPDEKTKEFLYDVSSFANASGGDLIFGISEVNGSPNEVCGVTVTNADEQKRKLESIIRDGIAPRISGILIETYPLKDSKCVLLVRIPKSWNSPHQVIYKGTDKFYTRSTNGKYKLDVAELRSSFLLSNTITERVRKFREERLAKIISDETPVQLLKNAKIVMQFIPLSSFDPGKSYDLSPIRSNPNLALSPLGGGSYDFRHNLDGLLSYTYRNLKDGYNSYLQLYRNGIIETVDSTMLQPYNGKLAIPAVSGFNYEENIISSFKNYCCLMERLKIEVPIFVFLSLLKVKGYEMGSDMLRFSRIGDPLIVDRDSLILPEIVLEDYQIDPFKFLRPLFDMIWNACGIERSYNFNENGEWRKN